MREVGEPHRPFGPSARLVRFVTLTILLQFAGLVIASRFMIRAIRTDGGTWTEYLFFGFYALVLVLGVGSAMLLLGALAHRLLGAGGERVLAVLLAALAGVALLVDLVTFAFLGLHPYGRATWAAVGSADIKQLPWFVDAGAAALVILALLMATGLWSIAGRFGRASRWERIEAMLPRRMAAYFALGLAAFIGLDSPDEERVVPRAALPFYGLWIARANSYPDARPAYPITPGPAPAAFARRPDIIVLQAESLRWDMLVPAWMPFLSRLALRPGCSAAQRHYAGGHLTQYGTFSLLYGEASYAFLPFMKQGRPSDPLAALHSAGYTLEGYDASGVLSYTIAPLAPSQFDRYETILGRDSTVLSKVIASLGVPAGAPRFIFGFLYTTHAWYFYPPSFARYPTAGPGIDTRTEAINRYHNSVGYLDAMLARLDSVLAPRLADGSAVLVVTGDHGEEFWEHGVQGHAAVGFQDERTRVPLVMCFPAASRMQATLSSHADILPTLLDWMGATGWDSIRLTGQSLMDATTERVVVLAGAGFPTQAGAFALVTPAHKFWLHLTGPDLAAVTLDQASDSMDRQVPLTPAVRQEFDRALAIYLRAQRTVLRVD